jgi:hypothetical protein
LRATTVTTSGRRPSAPRSAPAASGYGRSRMARAAAGVEDASRCGRAGRALRCGAPAASSTRSASAAEDLAPGPPAGKHPEGLRHRRRRA